MIVRNNSRHVCLLGTFLFLLTSIVPAAQPVTGGALRRAGSAIIAQLPILISKTTSSINKGLSSAYQKVRGFKAEVLIDTLLATIFKLGTQIGNIKDCMLLGNTCTPAKRAALYGTAITILALTAAVVGFSITIATTSKEPEEELNKAVEATSHEVKGWKPAAIFQRLSNKLAQFKQSLLSMRQCLIKRQCSKKQKRALYVTAATITALVTIAIGLGIGSYIYAKKREAQDQEALLKIVAAQEGQASREELQNALKELSLAITAEPFGPRTQFQEKIQTGIDVQQEGENFLQVTARTISAALRKKVQAAKNALEKITDKATKLSLFNEAAAALNNAKQIAQHFVAKIKEFSISDITMSIQQILNINLDPISNAIRTIQDNSANSIKFLNALTRVRLIEQIAKLNLDVASFIEKIYALVSKFQFQSEENKLLQAIETKLGELSDAMLDKEIKDAQEELRGTRTEVARAEIANRLSKKVTQFIRTRTEEYKRREQQVQTTEERILTRQTILKQLDKELRDLLKSEGKPMPPTPIEKEYPFWQTLSEVWSTYPTLLDQLNALNISAPGQFIASVLEDTASTLENLLALRTALPKIGPKLVSDELSRDLAILKTQLLALAENIREITSISPLIHTEGAPRTGALFYASLKQLARGRLFSLTQTASELLTKIGIQSGQLQNELTPLQESSQSLFNISTSVQTHVVKELEHERMDQLLSKVAQAPKLLLNAVGTTITDIKIMLNEILYSSSSIINRLSTILAYSNNLLSTVNDFVGSTADKPFVAPAVLEKIEAIASNAMGMAIIIERIRHTLDKEKIEFQPKTMAIPSA